MARAMSGGSFDPKPDTLHAPSNKRESFSMSVTSCRGRTSIPARLAAERHPEELTVEQRKAKREGKVFVDYMRNAYGQPAGAPYAVRALPGAPVATPLDWGELTASKPQSYRLDNLFRRLARRDDPRRDLAKAKGHGLSTMSARLSDLRESE